MEQREKLLNYLDKYDHLYYDNPRKMNKMEKRCITRIHNAYECIDDINNILEIIDKCNLKEMQFTESGAIKVCPENQRGAYYLEEVKTKRNVVKGWKLHISLAQRLWIIKIGCLSSKGNRTGVWAFNKVVSILKDFGINIEKYASVNGEEVKKEIVSPLITTAPLFTHTDLEHVYHIDLNKAYASCLIKKFPEFKEPFEYILNDKECKDAFNLFIGYCQSEYCDYRYSNIAKEAINGCREEVEKLISKLLDQNFIPCLLNTDGIYYYDNLGLNRVYTDENEGKGLGQWKTDVENVTLYIHSAGQYYYKKGDLFVPKCRGFYAYEIIKPRELWNEMDFFKATATLTNIEYNKNINRFEIIERSL